MTFPENSSNPTGTDVVWAAVHKLVQPSRQRIERAGNEWLAEQATDITDPAGGLNACHLPAYRRHQAQRAAAVVQYANVPSLWDQSSMALEGGEVQPGRGSKPLRERSPADLDLMEIRSIIRDTTRHELERLGVRTKRAKSGELPPFHPEELSRLANEAIRAEPEQLWWWQYRFAQWARLLETYLHAVEHQARPVRLRNSPCPTCGTRQVTIDQDGENVVVPALLVDFRDGYVRAAECSACGETWWRGPDLERLAVDLGVAAPVSDTPNVAAC